MMDSDDRSGPDTADLLRQIREELSRELREQMSEFRSQLLAQAATGATGAQSRAGRAGVSSRARDDVIESEPSDSDSVSSSSDTREGDSWRAPRTRAGEREKEVRERILENAEEARDFPGQRGLDPSEQPALFALPQSQRIGKPEIKSGPLALAYQTIYTLGHYVEEDLLAAAAAAENEPALVGEFLLSLRSALMGIAADALQVLDLSVSEDKDDKALSRAALAITIPHKGGFERASPLAKKLAAIKAEAGRRSARDVYQGAVKELAKSTNRGASMADKKKDEGKQKGTFTKYKKGNTKTTAGGAGQGAEREAVPARDA